MHKNSLMKEKKTLGTFEVRKKVTKTEKLRKFLKMTYLVGAISSSFVMPAFAAGNNDTSMAVVSVVLTIILTLVQLAGLFAVIQGVFNYFMGRRADDGEKQSKGFNEAIVGGLMIGFKYFIGLIISAAGIDGISI